MEQSVKKKDISPSNSGQMEVTTVYLKKQHVMDKGKLFMTKGIQHQIELADVITLEVFLLLLVQNKTAFVILPMKIVPVL